MNTMLSQKTLDGEMKTVTAEIDSSIRKIHESQPDSIYNFKRLEKKYLLNRFEAELLMGQVAFYIPIDKKSDENPFISSIYFDNEQWKCFNAQIEKQNPRFKLRLRQYGTDGLDIRRRFLEIKRKSNSISYKERLNIILPDSESAADFLMNYIGTGNMKIKVDSINEVYHKIRNVITDYKLEPVVQIGYTRRAFESNDRSLRITFNTGLQFRSFPNMFDTPSIEKYEMPDDLFIMEVKYKGQMPVWLKRISDQIKLRNSDFQNIVLLLLSCMILTKTPNRKLDH